MWCVYVCVYSYLSAWSTCVCVCVFVFVREGLSVYECVYNMCVCDPSSTYIDTIFRSLGRHSWITFDSGDLSQNLQLTRPRMQETRLPTDKD